MRSGEIKTTVAEEADGMVVEVFADDWMLGVWREGYRDVWAFALADKNIVRDAVREELARRGRSL